MNKCDTYSKFKKKMLISNLICVMKNSGLFSNGILVAKMRSWKGKNMNFADAMKKESMFTTTENGAVALRTTGNACLDLFGLVGSLRDVDDSRVKSLFSEAYKENPLFATKIVFYARDVRGGLGERKTFRTLIKYMAENHPESLVGNIDLIGFFGRYDDLYCLVGTPLEGDMWKYMKYQFEEDKENLEKGNCISLLAKWIKTADASSKNTRKLGILTANKLGYNVYDFKRIVRAMRRHIGVVESLMSARKWEEIKYSEVPSRAMMIYRDAFMRHDSERFISFVNKAMIGDEKINSSTLFPYDIVEKYLYHGVNAKSLEAQWRQLPNYVEEGTNCIVMADVSGSMYGRPMATSIGLALYFAERNKGAYHNMFMTFSCCPAIEIVIGETLEQKIRNIKSANWGMNTDLKSAFEKILDVAIKNNVPDSEMPKSIIVVSDMEIDVCSSRDWTFYDEVKYRYEEKGYSIPNIVFWNVESRNDVFHTDKKRKGVQLCSGQSTTVFKQLMGCVGFSPVEMMEKVINSERYDCISIFSKF